VELIESEEVGVKGRKESVDDDDEVESEVEDDEPISWSGTSTFRLMFNLLEP